MQQSNALITLPAGAMATASNSGYRLSVGDTTIALKRDVHFGKPNERLKQPVLYKGGAEHIRISYGVFDRYELMAAVEDYENGFFFYRFKCSLIKLNPHDGKEYVVTEGYGSANSRESSGGTASGFDLANQRLKIAEKRAMVDAVIKMAGLSSLFTQDIENDTFMEGAKAVIADNPESVITSKQSQRIFAIAGSVGMSQEQCRTWLKARGIESTRKVLQKDYDTLCESLLNEGGGASGV